MDDLINHMDDDHDSCMALYHGDYSNINVCCSWPRNKIDELFVGGRRVLDFNGKPVDEDLSRYILPIQNGIITRNIYMCGGDPNLIRKEVFQIVKGRWRKWTKKEIIDNQMCIVGTMPS